MSKPKHRVFPIARPARALEPWVVSRLWLSAPRVLPEGSSVPAVSRAGHFLKLEQPQVVAGHIVDFAGQV